MFVVDPVVAAAVAMLPLPLLEAARVPESEDPVLPLEPADAEEPVLEPETLDPDDPEELLFDP
jgi:hypothetical protein